MKYFNLTLNWIRHNTGYILFMSVVALILVSNIYYTNKKTKLEKETVECNDSCFPQQSQYLEINNKQSCWCYIDKQTMKRRAE